MVIIFFPRSNGFFHYMFVLGLLACGVGIFVAMPVILAATAYAYEDIFGTGSASPAQPV